MCVSFLFYVTIQFTHCIRHYENIFDGYVTLILVFYYVLPNLIPGCWNLVPEIKLYILNLK